MIATSCQYVEPCRVYLLKNRQHSSSRPYKFTLIEEIAALTLQCIYFRLAALETGRTQELFGKGRTLGKTTRVPVFSVSSEL